MIYFVRRSFEADENKITHKKHLKDSVNGILKSAFKAMGIEYSENCLSYGSHGKPYLKNHSDVYFNISHCHEMAVAAICNSEIGIDVENIREYRPRVAKKVFSERENMILQASENPNETFFRIWTLKESFVKAIGIGISYPMKTCEFLLNDNGFSVNGCDGFTFRQIIVNDKFICSVCVKAPDRPENNFCKINTDEFSFNLNL